MGYQDDFQIAIANFVRALQNDLSEKANATTISGYCIRLEVSGYVGKQPEVKLRVSMKRSYALDTDPGGRTIAGAMREALRRAGYEEKNETLMLPEPPKVEPLDADDVPF